MSTLVLTVIGDDRAGLVNALADVVARHGGNWERSEMAQLAGKFAGIVLVTVPDGERDALVAALSPLASLHVQAHPADGAETGQLGPAHIVHLLGNDRPGIVQEVTRVLRDHDVSIESFTSATVDAPMAGGQLFEARIGVLVPAGGVEGVRSALEALAAELMVDIGLDQPDQG